MPSYVAFLRGIGPSNPNMRNERLRGVAEGLGYARVRTLLSSGNLLFDTDDTDVAALEATLESAWPDQLGFESTTIIRSADELRALVDLEPFGDREHGAETYLLVTFAKEPVAVDFSFPHQPPGREYWIVEGTDRELFSVSDTTGEMTPDVMAWMEARFGKKISSRTWLTVKRVLNRLGS